MATQPLTLARRLMTTLVKPEVVRQEASRLGVVDRQGKVDSFSLAMVVAFGIFAKQDASIAQLGRLYGESTGDRVARSSFWDRLTPAFADLMNGVLRRLLAHAESKPRQPKGSLRAFRDVLAADATVLKVHDDLAQEFKGTRKNSAKAAIKVHAISRVATGELLRADVTAEAVSDSKAFRATPTLRGSLILFDRGYASPTLWRKISKQGAFFLTRIPKGWNLIVSKDNGRHRGRARDLMGKNLRAELATLQRKVVDVDVIFRCRVRGYGGRRSRKVDEVFRVVAVRKPDGEYNLYVTNAPPTKLAASVVAKTYRLRWEVETLFKAAKTGLHLPPPRTSRKGATLALIYAGLIRVALAMLVRRATLRESPLQSGTINLLQWARWWKRHHTALLKRLVPWEALSDDDVLAMLRDPNIKRGSLRASFSAGEL